MSSFDDLFSPPWPDGYDPQPSELQEAYEQNKIVGAACDPLDTAKLLRELPMPTFGAAAPDLIGSGDGKLVRPYLSLLKFDPGAFSERQTTGSCVSHGTRNAIDITRAVEIDIRGDAEDFVNRGATEPIYGCRGHGGQGMTCSEAVRFVTQNGGVIVRGKYGSIDLTKLDDSLAASWGRRGVPEELVEECKKHQIKTASQVKSIEELKAALANGYGVTTCGSESWSSQRDENGISEQTREGWPHCVTYLGFDDTRELANECLFIMANSWAAWCRGGNPKWGELPIGCWLAREKVTARRLASGGSYAVSNFDGFPARKLPYYDPFS